MNNFLLSFQAYAVKMTPENRQNCAVAAEPLLESVDNLVAFASSPEFASIPAKISPQVTFYLIQFLKRIMIIVIELPLWLPFTPEKETIVFVNFESRVISTVTRHF